MQTEFREYIYKTNLERSNKASSYIRALDMLGGILSMSSGPFNDVVSVWEVASEDKIESLREYILVQQKTGDIFQTEHASSYWRKGHYSAALRSYHAFLIERKYENDLMSVFEKEKFTADDFTFEPKGKEVVAEVFKGREEWRETKVRIDQNVFRRKILSIYGGECCITGLNVPALNVASHIIPWSEREDRRLDPRNGLCLSGTFDLAFDRHLIGLDDDYRVIVSSALKEFYSRAVVKQIFDPVEGTQIRMPSKFLPDQELLATHLSLLVG